MVQSLDKVGEALAVVTREGTHQRANAGADHGVEDDDRERDRTAIEESCEEIPTDVVGAHDVGRRWRLSELCGIDRVEWVGRDPRREDHQRGEGAQHGRRDERQPVTPELTPEELLLRDGDVGSGTGRRLRVELPAPGYGVHRYEIRGSSQP